MAGGLREIASHSNWKNVKNARTYLIQHNRNMEDSGSDD